MSKILYSLKSLKDLLKKEKPSRVVVVTSVKLISKLGWAIKEIGISKKDLILIPDGEAAKGWEQVRKLLERFIESGLDRKSIIIALGGGSVGDVVGFTSAIYLRGIKYIQVPTTLLAQVDSAHGGKTGINFLQYKNQIGSFHAPVVVILDKRFLKSLASEQVVDGLGEILKAGLIRDPSILRLLKKEKTSTLIKSKNLGLLTKKAIQVKTYYTSQDFKDTGARQILNLGHTIGHALELKYNISHGRAVLTGILQELQLAEILGVTPTSIRENLTRLIKNLGIKIDKNLTPDLKILLRDKKISGKYIDLPIIEEEGKPKLLKLNIKELNKTLEARRYGILKIS